MYFEIFRGIL